MRPLNIRPFAWMKLAMLFGGFTSMLSIAQLVAHSPKGSWTLFGIPVEAMEWLGGATAIIFLIVAFLGWANKIDVFKNIGKFFRPQKQFPSKQRAEPIKDALMQHPKSNLPEAIRKMMEEAQRKTDAPKPISSLKLEFAEVERRYSQITVSVHYSDGHIEKHSEQDGLHYIVHRLRNGMTPLMLMEHSGRLIEFKRVFRNLSEIKRELLNRKPLEDDGKKLLADVNDFYRSSFESYTPRTSHAYLHANDVTEANEWKLLDVPFKDIWSNSHTRLRVIGTAANPPEIILFRLNVDEVRSYGRMKIRIRNPRTNSFLLESIVVKSNTGEEFDYSTNYNSRKLIAPQWLEPNAPLDFTLYVREFRNDTHPNLLIHIEAEFDDIQTIKSNEEAVPPYRTQ